MADDKPQSSLAEIKAGLGDLSSVKVFNNQVLVGIWRRPEKTKGGIILTDKTRDEDKWQGKVGYVLKKGPLAFKSDDRVQFADDVSEGDCVVYRTSDGFPLDINGIHCRLLEDVHVKAIVTDPAVIW
jgi:co-chaperonin GroES (HSP10)